MVCFLKAKFRDFGDAQTVGTTEPDMSEWKEYKLRDICTDISYGYTASANDEPVGPKFLRITDIVSDRILWDTVPFCKIDADLKARYKLDVGDIVIARTGATTGYNAIIKEPVDAVFASYLVRYKVDRSIADPFYVSYLLKSNEWKGFVENVSGGSAQPGANAQQLADFEFLLPPLPEQRAIASVLSSLDDKIDLLHRQNKTLEALAETLFRQWFVEEAEEGWEEASLYDAIEMVGGGTPKTEVPEYWDGEIKWISGRDITPNHKSFIVETEKRITKLGLEKSATKILPGFATIISARGTVGKYCLLSEPMAFSQTNYGITPKIRECYFFTYLLIAHSVEELQAASYGSVFDTITTNTFREHRIQIPSEGEIRDFEEKVRLYFMKMLSNSIHIRTLTRMRDTLLPKLMRGEVRVKV
jgi:type I restriction enzyme S subunit